MRVDGERNCENRKNRSRKLPKIQSHSGSPQMCYSKPTIHIQKPMAFIVAPTTFRRNERHTGLTTTTRKGGYYTRANLDSGAGKAAINENAYRFSKWIAADWSNMKQSLEAPQFWSHIHVVFRPLAWEFMEGSYSFYTESAYDYLLGSPYKSGVIRIIESDSDDDDDVIELETYKVKEEVKSEFWLGGHEPEILDDLKLEHLERMNEGCNTVYKFDKNDQVYNGCIRPGKKCVVRRAGKGPLAYIDSTLTLTESKYTAWDLGRDIETDERLWGTPAGPFDFIRNKDLSNLVPNLPIQTSSAKF